MANAPTLFSVLLLLASLGADALRGQEPDRPCDYDRCALRIEQQGILSLGRVVRGLEGVPVADFDRSGELRDLFARSDSAAAHYEAFARADLRADWIYRTGLLFTAASLGLYVGGQSDEHTVWAIGLQVTSFGVTLGSGIPRASARRAFNRAIWWYNRSLPRR